MNKIKLAAVAGGLAAAIVGLAPAAQAAQGGAAPETKIGIDHLDWLDDIQPKVMVPNVDTDVQHPEIVLPLPF